ncbi:MULTISPECIES: LLM class flavin-dependent oxidoreductase [Rhizobium/Agrobacterium group]|uniref:LLM class flavin-dependent oxidoreductase n=1 Tax=Agrobacterium rosae TaxID=1972867 RepID=UPI002033BDF4|nr:LLM class flavin-dependent oxidoreductase [Agrobacterium rosae]MCM2436091.1 LLM class flavin-dependent oxidoreductase [Agrobacterium rosae]
MCERKMKIGLSMRGLGYHQASWRKPNVPALGSLDLQYKIEIARIAERAKFDLIFFADGLGIRTKDIPVGANSHSHENVEFEPLTLLSALSQHTKHIGLICTASTTYNDPFNLARRFASLDHLSGGRAGWNVVASWSDEEAKNFGKGTPLDYPTRYERATEFLDVVNGLWQSWESDAFVLDKASGQFYDPSKLNVLNHSGKYFAVRGPLTVSPSPQGKPIIVQAGASEEGTDLAASRSDVVYAASDNVESLKKFYAIIKSKAEAFGRDPAKVVVMPALSTFVGESRSEAEDKLAEIDSLIDPLVGLSRIARFMGDLSGYSVDTLVEDIQLEANAGLQSFRDSMVAMSKRDKLTIRQLYTRLAGGLSLRLVGTAKDIADEMESLFAGGAADGFNLTPAVLPTTVEDFATLVVPELQRRGLFREEYESDTLRGNLGLAG